MDISTPLEEMVPVIQVNGTTTSRIEGEGFAFDDRTGVTPDTGLKLKG